jgi:hypothetical protein
MADLDGVSPFGSFLDLGQHDEVRSGLDHRQIDELLGHRLRPPVRLEAIKHILVIEPDRLVVVLPGTSLLH